MNGHDDPLPAANELNPSVSVEVASALRAAMMMNREQRPVNAATLRTMLREGTGSSSSFSSTVVAAATVTTDAWQGQTQPTGLDTKSATTARPGVSFLLKGGVAFAVVLMIAASGFVWRSNRDVASTSAALLPTVEISAAPVAKMPAPAEATFRFDTAKLNVAGKITGREVKQGRYFSEDVGGGASIDMVATPGGVPQS